jgi:hypothetical protein
VGTPVDRRRFSAACATALLGGATITISGCGGGGSPTAPGPTPSPAPTAEPTPTPTPTPGEPAPGDAVGSITNDPSHRAVITAAQLEAGGFLTLNIQGSAAHGHLATLDGVQVAAIRDGETVTVRSTEALHHTHLVTFN